MSSFIMTLYTTKNIGTREYAVRFFGILGKYNILPDKIGRYEPLRAPYSLEEAVKLWMFIGGTMPDFRRGGLIGKKKEPNIQFDTDWTIGERANVNSVTIWFTRKSFQQIRNSIDSLFKDLIIAIDSFYGYISDYYAKDRQHVTGSIETRMHGIFWCNYFGDVYVKFFGKDKILSAPWFKIEILDQNKIITYLAKEPTDRRLIKSTELENKLKEYLGDDSFGDVETWKATYNLPGDHIQYRHVPKLDLSEIRRPLSEFL
jgi:hypothetical protein